MSLIEQPEKVGRFSWDRCDGRVTSTNIPLVRLRQMAIPTAIKAKKLSLTLCPGRNRYNVVT